MADKGGRARDGPAIVLAGPGSGKTRVIVERAVRLIDDDVARPEQLLVLTWLRLTADGTLILEGQDLGGAVSEFWGSDFTEYEWGWALPRGRLPALLGPLGIAADSEQILEDVGRRLKQLDRAEAQQRFKDAGAEFWSRAGD